MVSMKKILIIGAGNGGEVIVNILSYDKENEIIGFLDDNKALHGKQLAGRAVIGGSDKIEELHGQGRFTHLIISITSNMKVRKMLFERFRSKGYDFVNAIHPKAHIEPSAKIGTGNIICAFVHIGYGAVIGDDNLLSVNSSIEHHNRVGSHILFGPNCVTSGDVHIGDNCIFGTGIFVEPHIRIGNNVLVASGSIIISHLKEDTILKSKVRAADVR
jgi:UDP-perosamine 4-acetyltransferase